MKIGVLSDAHGNPGALERCLRFLKRRGVEAIWFLGDSIGYLPEGGAVLDMLVESGAEILLGNHDAMAISALELTERGEQVYKIREQRAALSTSHAAQLRAALPFREGRIGERQVLFVHGSPWQPLTEYVYPDADLQAFSALPHDIVFMGHTHRPFVAMSGECTVLNVGSCGLPRDQGNLASCAIYDSYEHECSIHRIPFDAESIAAQHQGRIHPSVAEVLRRKAKAVIVGEQVAAREYE
jgi:putative phosphoesterase